MSDPRRTPVNTRVAASFLRGLCDAPLFVDGELREVNAPVVDLLRGPSGPRDRQLQLGAKVMVYDCFDGMSFVQSEADGYVGYIKDTALRAPSQVTHRVISRATHAYERPDMKSTDQLWLGMGCQLETVAEVDGFLETTVGYVPKQHLAQLGLLSFDPVAVAESLLGTPYLWGGNSALGIDCSGLVQMAYQLCGWPCPGDSDMQEAELGQTVTDGTYQRGDLLFWKGHVAFVRDAETLLHANAFHMAVALEPLEDALIRIEQQGDGRVTRHARRP